MKKNDVIIHMQMNSSIQSCNIAKLSMYQIQSKIAIQ